MKQWVLLLLAIGTMLAKRKLHLRSYFLRMRAGALAVWPTGCVIGSWIADILARILDRTSAVKVGPGGRWCTVVL